MVIDDFIDMPSVVRKENGVLSSIAIRGRHGNVTCFYMTLKYRALGTEIRTNFNALMFFRQRSRFDLEAFFIRCMSKLLVRTMVFCIVI